jgi:transcriptional regulator GlxA family with amidase domain
MRQSSAFRPGQKRVLILGLPPVDALDVIGPAEVFAYANRLRHGAEEPYLIELVTSGSDLSLASETGIGLTAHRTLEVEQQSSLPIDTLIVTSGIGAIDHLDPYALDWIRSRAGTIRRICSICVGAFALAGTGLLDGRRATTHWAVSDELASRFPSVTVDPTPIWIKDGNVYTSAGISSGIDLALSLVCEDLGDEVGMQIAKNLVLFLRRPGGQAQFSVALRSQRVTTSGLQELCSWISENLHRDLTVDEMARRSAMSVRTLIRAFQRELETTPARYVEDCRLEAASRALELGEQSMEKIARRCGYRSADVLRKAFARRLGVSPKEYARNFARSAG